METIQSIDDQIKDLWQRKNEAESADFRENLLPRVQKLLGATFVYRNNSYSCPGKPSDYWDVFRRVLRIVVTGSSSGAWLIFEECEIDRDHKPTLKVDARLSSSADMGMGWRQCTDKEYGQMRAKVMAAIESPDAYADELSAV